MNLLFPKDILIIDFETSHTDLEKAKPLQIGAVLLDRSSLEEINHFVSYVQADLTDASPKTLAINGITKEKLVGAPEAKEVARRFVETFGKNFFYSGWVCEKDRALFRKMMLETGINPSEFDYHLLDVWPIAYAHLIKKGYQGSTGSEPMFKEFGLTERGSHDALDDCRRAAEILRIVLGG